MFFLSHADEDGNFAVRVAEMLSVFAGEVVRSGQAATSEQLDEQIRAADAFVVLVSPAYLQSHRGHWERELALHRVRTRPVRAAGSFFGVLLLDAVPDGLGSGLPDRADWVDLTDPQNFDSAIRSLLDKLGAGTPDEGVGSKMADLGQTAPLFRNRVDELELVRNQLTNVSGAHFWLVIAPPKMGKSWFLHRLNAILTLDNSVPWTASLVNLRDQPPQVRASASKLLRLFFDIEVPDQPGPDSILQIAKKILSERRPWLCLLDNAELLAEDTARTLRECMAEISKLVWPGPLPDVRLAFVIAARTDVAWRRVGPRPRISILPLTGFKVEVVEEAVSDLAAELDFDVATRAVAELAHSLSEGLPALLVQCLWWMRDEVFVRYDRLAIDSVFTQLAEPYVRDNLLSHDSLFPLGDGQHEPQSRGSADARRAALHHCLRGLVPYRFFTKSHVRELVAQDPDVARAVADLHWSHEDLWRAISGTALITRPLDEIWSEIQPEIRRLLFRYYYLGADKQETAHLGARKFVEIWGEGQSGKEQVIGMVDCLWHEAAALRGSADLAARITHSAKTLSSALTGSSAYAPDELRRLAVNRITADVELQAAVDDDALFDNIIELVQNPGSE